MSIYFYLNNKLFKIDRRIYNVMRDFIFLNLFLVVVCVYLFVILRFLNSCYIINIFLYFREEEGKG